MFNFWLSFCQAKDMGLNDYMVMPEWCPLIDVTNLSEFDVKGKEE
jgi:hypothetical protein